MALWIIAIFAALILAGFLALQWAIRENGPAVLNAADRLTGGARHVALLERAAYGASAAHKLLIYGPETRSKAKSEAGGDAKNEARSNASARPVIIFAHGGSWYWGDPDDYGFIARALVPEGFIVVLAGYRLYPEAQYPQMLEDTAQAVAWTQANIARHGGDPDRIFLAGHSAGAYNVVMSALDRQWLKREGLDADDLAGVIVLAGPYDFYPFDSDSTKASFGEAARPEATQPVNAARGDAPPMLLIHGAKDALVRPRNSRILAEKITAAGGRAEVHVFPEMAHNEPLMALASPYRRDARIIDLITQFASSAQTSVSVHSETR